VSISRIELVTLAKENDQGKAIKAQLREFS
jgi:hypothetical protein